MRSSVSKAKFVLSKSNDECEKNKQYQILAQTFSHSQLKGQKENQ